MQHILMIYTAYHDHSVQHAATIGAIQGFTVVILALIGAAIVYLCRNWGRWFAKNKFMRVGFPPLTIGSLLLGFGGWMYHDGGWDAVGAGFGCLVVLLAMALFLYFKRVSNGAKFP
jgi:hypothetical protein